jgi:hypothetical protein
VAVVVDEIDQVAPAAVAVEAEPLPASIHCQNQVFHLLLQWVAVEQVVVLMLNREVPAVPLLLL